MEGDSSKRMRTRSFMTGDAVNPAVNYHVKWNDLQQLVTEITDNSHWLLITGPWQSGKTSLMYALTEAVECKGFHPVETTLSAQLVSVANNTPNVMEAEDRFFDLLANRLVGRSRGVLRRGKSTGIEGVTEMFLQPQKKEIIWFIDEASLLNDIKKVSIVQQLLSELRQVKRNSVSRKVGGGYYLRSFVLVGTPKVKQLIGDMRVAENYESLSPGWSPDDPLGESISPLSLECEPRNSDSLSVDGIAAMLNEYRLDHEDADFRLAEGLPGDGTVDATIRKLSRSIWSLTSGHKGMVCTCCHYMAARSVFTYTQWKKDVRLGHVAKYVFCSKAYSRVISNIIRYPIAAQGVVLKCIKRGVPVSVNSLYPVLRPLSDGVLETAGVNAVQLTSGLLLSAFLEDCSFAPLEALPEVSTFTEVIQAAFPLIKHQRLIKPEVVNANGQPSEYVWQCEFLMALKFVLEHAYNKCKYTIMVEAKRKDKNGTQLDFLLKHQGTPSKGFELQGVGDRATIKKHIKKSRYYGELHSCEMHYIYLQYGSCGLDAKAVIKEEAAAFPDVKCWFVHYAPHANNWNIQQLKDVDGIWTWVAHASDAATNFPKFVFQQRRKVDS